MHFFNFAVTAMTVGLAMATPLSLNVGAKVAVTADVDVEAKVSAMCGAVAAVKADVSVRLDALVGITANVKANVGAAVDVNAIVDHLSCIEADLNAQISVLQNSCGGVGLSLTADQLVRIHAALQDVTDLMGNVHLVLGNLVGCVHADILAKIKIHVSAVLKCLTPFSSPILSLCKGIARVGLDIKVGLNLNVLIGSCNGILGNILAPITGLLSIVL